MSFMLIALAFIAVLGPLVALHEWGHYIVARLCGVKVLTYSIGFGPKLASWTSKKSGIDYRISALPLGGYVKMLDEREAEVADSEKHLAFNNQHPLKKIAIVAAGPIMNFIIAIALFWVLFLVPSEQLNTRIGSVLPDSPAASVSLPVGDKIVAVDGHAVKTWEEVNYRLADRMGETGSVRVTLQPMDTTSITKQTSTASDADSQKPVASEAAVTESASTELASKETATESVNQQPAKQVNVPIRDFLQGSESGKDTLSGLGILPWQPHIEPIVAQLTEDGAAIRQGMKVGDKIIAIEGQPIDDWIDATHIIRDNPEKLLNFTVQRKNDAGEMQQVDLQIMPQGKKAQAGQRYGQIGAGVDPGEIVVPDEYKTMVSYGPIGAITQSFAKTGQLATMTLNSMGKMITGKVGLENLSGPISIAVVSKQSFDISWKQVLSTAAIISLSLAVLNLLPIPVLDGGHLVYYLIELIRGKPLPEHMQAIGFNIGFLLLIGFMILAITNDFSRYF
ncbi:RIP metalloprotease RseP [Psychrobacter sp. FDAARGOS_221]|uniref:RIP metalloprotease RseP n=1 Tax=Psychrobacter sp. FDAARGOS_221 TaxID=1975705 RepID=UPI000BB59477|nr:RIP metalloprotease RseP [Psychrobacter sp. FDAARGOS_221]PNK61374.1 RIP metalloprotease RseP [Psychrobacter sp. FDAARGOS_221]